MFATHDLEKAIRASIFNKGLGPNGFDGKNLRPGDTTHRLIQDHCQILGLLNNLTAIPKYLYEWRLVPQSNKKSKGSNEDERHKIHLNAVPCLLNL
jgi:hypothetical protein